MGGCCSNCLEWLGCLKPKDKPSLSRRPTMDYSDLEDLVQRVPGSIRRVLLLGPPASGKSTFVNCLANYFLEGSLKDMKIVIPNALHPVTEREFPPHSESDIANPAVNHTQKCETYPFEKKGVMYSFVDTLGLSDSADDSFVDRILAAASEGEKLSAIILVVKGSDVHLTDKTIATLQRIKTNFPDILLNNLIIVYTHTMGSSLLFDESSLPHKPVKSYIMNNSAFSSVALNREGEDAQIEELFWKGSMRKSAEIVTFVELLAQLTIEAGKNMQEYKNTIKTQVMNATCEIEKQQKLLEILDILRALEIENEREVQELLGDIRLEEAKSRRLKAQQDSEKAKRLQTEMDKKDVEKRKQAFQSMKTKVEAMSWTFYDYQSTPYHNTLCRSCKCTCHKDCSLTFTQELGNNIFKHCAAMDSKGLCEECKKHKGCDHDYTTHIHARSVFVEVTLSVAQKKEEILTRYNNNVRAVAAAIEKLRTICQDLQQIIDQYNQQIRALDVKSEQYRAEEDKLNKQKDEAEKRKQAAEESLQDAKKQKLTTKTHREEIESDISESKTKLAEAEKVLERQSRLLKLICSRYDFKAELDLTNLLLNQALEHLQNEEVRTRAMKFIERMTRLAETP